MARGDDKLDDVTRVAILLRDGGVCVYCLARSMDGVSMEADHLVSRKYKGSDDPTNLVCACETCNRDKAHMHLATYLVHRAATGQSVEGIEARIKAALARPVDLALAAVVVVEIRAEKRAAVRAARKAAARRKT